MAIKDLFIRAKHNTFKAEIREYPHMSMEQYERLSIKITEYQSHSTKVKCMMPRLALDNR